MVLMSIVWGVVVLIVCFAMWVMSQVFSEHIEKHMTRWCLWYLLKKPRCLYKKVQGGYTPTVEEIYLTDATKIFHISATTIFASAFLRNLEKNEPHFYEWLMRCGRYCQRQMLELVH